METLKWGFIGAGGIAKRALYPAISKSSVGEIYAVASRDLYKARTISPNGIVYDDYDALLADPKVEAVYISLPNSLHIPLTIKALNAGKHVLCEKPLGMNPAEVQEATELAASKGLLLVEASWNRWHPRTQRIQQIMKSGTLGKIHRIRTAFTFDGLDGGDIRNVRELGGGMVYDLGPYAIAAPLWLMDFPEVSGLEVRAVVNQHGVDETIRSNFNLGTTRCETTVSCNIQFTHWLIVEGENGTLRTGGNDSFFSHNQPSSLELDINGKETIENFKAEDPYQLMADAFARKVRGEDVWVMPLTESLRFSQLFEQILSKIQF